MGTLPTGALNARGREKVAISDQYLAIACKRLLLLLFYYYAVDNALVVIH